MPPGVVHTPRPEPWLALFNPATMALGLWRRRDLIAQFAWRFFVARHRGTYLGVLWAAAFPLAMLTVYTFVFNYIFVARVGANASETQSQYAVMLFCGIVVFGIFAESVTRASHLIVEHPNYVKRVVFPVEVLPVASLAAGVMTSLFGLGLTLAGVLTFYGELHWSTLMLPLVLLPLAALALGLSWFLAALTVFVRDTAHAASILIGQALFFATPIFYRIENLPEHWRGIAMLNPLAVVVDSARRVMVQGESPRWGQLLLAGAISLVVMQGGYAFFGRARRGFADVL